MRFRAKARQLDIYWSEAGSVLKEKGRERAGKGEGAKGRLSTRLIFSRDPSLYQDHVCHSPLGTILVKIHASHFYIRFLSFLPLTKGRAIFFARKIIYRNYSITSLCIHRVVNLTSKSNLMRLINAFLIFRFS